MNYDSGPKYNILLNYVWNSYLSLCFILKRFMTVYIFTHGYCIGPPSLAQSLLPPAPKRQSPWASFPEHNVLGMVDEESKQGLNPNGKTTTHWCYFITQCHCYDMFRRARSIRRARLGHVATHSNSDGPLNTNGTLNVSVWVNQKWAIAYGRSPGRTKLTISIEMFHDFNHLARTRYNHQPIAPFLDHRNVYARNI